MNMGKAAHVCTARLLDYVGSRSSERSGQLGWQQALLPLMQLESTAGGSLLHLQALFANPTWPRQLYIRPPWPANRDNAPCLVKSASSCDTCNPTLSVMRKHPRGSFGISDVV